MASINEIRAALRGAIEEIESGMELRAKLAGSDVAALVADRVRNGNGDSTGSPFSPYSTKEVPAFWFVNRSRSASAEAKVKAASKRGAAISYRDFRQFNNLRIDAKNFEFTGQMWRLFDVVEVKPSQRWIEVTVSGTTQFSRNLFRWHSEREGVNLAAASEQELEIIQGTLEQWVSSIIKKNLSNV
jgi:hypothetical protein